MEFLSKLRREARSVWSKFVVKLPGYPAFLLSTSPQKGEAAFKFLVAVAFSLSPLLLIAFLDASAAPTFNFFKSLGKYTEAGQIYFYVGSIIGGAFILIRDNFREDTRKRAKLSAGEEFMKTERTWFMVYMLLVSLISVVILCVYHLNVTKRPEVIYVSSAVVYAVSLYVWYVDILYSQVDLGAVEGDGESDDEAGGDPPQIDAQVGAIEKSLAEFGGQAP